MHKEKISEKEVINMIHPLKITSTLADDTRFQIYEYMLQEKKPFTVQNIAVRFGIHPNVARLHLTKLTEINVIESDYLKTGKGGRPGRVYKASVQGISLSFPRRDESTLLKWTLQLLEELGPDALTKCKNISYKDGFQEMQTFFTDDSKIHQEITFDQKIELLSSSAALLGYIPTITETTSGKKIIFSMHNCPFNSQLFTNAEIICALHESYLKGQIDALFPKSDFFQFESMAHDCQYCKYEINVTETK